MPRIKEFNTRYRLKDLSTYVLGEMRAKGITQNSMAEALGMSQGNFSTKIKNLSFSTGELMIIFENLGTSPEKAGELITGRRTT